MARCQHTPVPAYMKPKTTALGLSYLLSQYQDYVQCSGCGRYGFMSHGQRRGGGRKIRWLSDEAVAYDDLPRRVASWNALVAQEGQVA